MASSASPCPSASSQLLPIQGYQPGDTSYNGYFYPTLQVNGQKHIGPFRSWENMGLPAPPEYEREIYIGNIPAWWTENTLMEYLMAVGRVYFLRFMVNFSGQCRGFAYVQYLEPNITAIAVESLNRIFNYFSFRTYAAWSRNIRRLEIGNFHSSFMGNLQILQKILLEETQCQSIEIMIRNGLVILVLTFQNNRKACLCRRQLLANLEYIGSKAYVSWFDRTNKAHSKLF